MASSKDAEGFPRQACWEVAPPLRFNTDWCGRNAAPDRETEVKLLWTPDELFLRFRAKYRTITVFPDAQTTGRRDQLWDRDVAEVFLQPDPSISNRYMEFEVSPNGFWIDLDIAPGQKRELQCNWGRRVVVNEANKVWLAELAIQMKCLITNFDPAAIWKVNFFRVEGPSEPRFYSAWRPTMTKTPDFHVPEAFGNLVFQSAPSPRK